MLRYWVLCLLLLPTAALAEKSYFYESVKYHELPPDIQAFLNREDACYVLHDQSGEWDEDQKKAAANARCDDLGCDRVELLRKQSDAYLIKVIKEYNSSLWLTDFASHYGNLNCN